MAPWRRENYKFKKRMTVNTLILSFLLKCSKIFFLEVLMILQGNSSELELSVISEGAGYFYVKTIKVLKVLDLFSSASIGNVQLACFTVRNQDLTY